MGIFFKKNNKRDEEVFFKILFDNYKEKIYRIAYYILKNEDDAKDIVQETFITAFDKIEQLRDKEKFESWICTICSNLAKRKYRQKKREILIEDEHKVIPFVSRADYLNIPEDLLEKREFKQSIIDHINTLKEHYREVIYLYYFVGLSYEEISIHLEISIGTVKSRLSRAKEILKSKLEKNMDRINRNEVDYYEDTKFIR